MLLFLLNADEEYVSGIRKDDADTQIKKLQIMRRKNLSVYSNDIALVQEIHETTLEEQWQKVKKDDEINEYITSLSPLEKTSYKEETKEFFFMNSLVENGRIHEIAILKKSKYRFFYEKIENAVISGKTLRKLQEEYNNININYENDKLFQEKTSYKDMFDKLYKNIHKTNYCEKTSEKLSEKINKNKESYITKKEMKETLLTTVVSIIGAFLSLTKIPEALKILSDGIANEIKNSHILRLGIIIANNNLKITLIGTGLLVVVIWVLSRRYFKKWNNPRYLP